MNVYLGLALIAALMYATSAIFLKEALIRGCSFWQINFFANLGIGILCAPLWLFVDSTAAKGPWNLAIWAGLTSIIGQVFTFLAFSRSDPSITTPLLGTKVLWVALISAVFFVQSLPLQWWWAAGLAVLGIFFVTGIQPVATKGNSSAFFGIFFAIASAIFFALTDVLFSHAARFVGNLGAIAMTYSEVGFLTLAAYPMIFGRKIWIIRSEQGLNWAIFGLTLLSLQGLTIGLSVVLSRDATAANVLYSSRCVWGVLLSWAMARFLNLGESRTSKSAMLLRVVGAILLFAAILVILL